MHKITAKLWQILYSEEKVAFSIRKQQKICLLIDKLIQNNYEPSIADQCDLLYLVAESDNELVFMNMIKNGFEKNSKSFQTSWVTLNWEDYDKACGEENKMFIKDPTLTDLLVSKGNFKYAQILIKLGARFNLKAAYITAYKNLHFYSSVLKNTKVQVANCTNKQKKSALIKDLEIETENMLTSQEFLDFLTDKFKLSDNIRKKVAELCGDEKMKLDNQVNDRIM